MRSSLLFFLFSIIISSCSVFQQKKEIEKTQKGSVISIYVDQRIDVSKFNELDALAANIAHKKSLRLDTITNLLRQKTLDTFSTQLPFRLVPEKDVINNTAYQNHHLSDSPRFVPITPQGYKGIPVYHDHKAHSLFHVLPDNTEAVMIVGLHYKLLPAGKAMTFVSAKVQSHLTIKVINRQGDTLLSAEKFAKSHESIKFSLGGVFEAREIRPLCIDASLQAIAKMERYLPQKL